VREKRKRRGKVEKIRFREQDLQQRAAKSALTYPSFIIVFDLI
jgi:type II secretory pathway component PulF